MAEIRIIYMDKNDTDKMLPELFDILYENMKTIAQYDYCTDRSAFLREVGQALKKEPRKIILLYAGNCLVGYFQYYVNNGVFMVEEVQLRPRYQRTGAFGKLVRFLKTVIPMDTQWIEAYAHKNNLHSQSIMHSLGMGCIHEKGELLHFRGDFSELLLRL